MLQFTAKIDPNFLGKTARLMPSAQDCYLMAVDLHNVIRKRTQAGLDVDGKPFAEYSEQTKLRKTELGRNPDLVDLTDKNRMLGQSLQASQIKDGGRIFFADANRREIAMRHNIGIGVPQRTFFSISKRDFDEATANLQKRIASRAR